MSTTWPPPPTAESPWHTRRLDIAGLGLRPVKVREVFLWGEEVLIDETHALWCSRCRRFVPTTEVQRAARGYHAYDARPRRGVYVPSSCKPTPASQSPAGAIDAFDEVVELDGPENR